MKMEQTDCSKTLAFKLQTPMNHPEESIQQMSVFAEQYYLVCFYIGGADCWL
jgi:hypothetical protein